MSCEVRIDKTGRIILRVVNGYTGKESIIPLNANEAHSIGMDLVNYAYNANDRKVLISDILPSVGVS